MYTVMVRLATDRSHIFEVKNFEFGKFAEIGYWLDENFYNESGYVVEIRFTR